MRIYTPCSPPCSGIKGDCHPANVDGKMKKVDSFRLSVAGSRLKSVLQPRNKSKSFQDNSDGRLQVLTAKRTMSLAKLALDWIEGRRDRQGRYIPPFILCTAKAQHPVFLASILMPQRRTRAGRRKKRKETKERMGRACVQFSICSCSFVSFGYDRFGCGRRPRCVLGVLGER